MAKEVAREGQLSRVNSATKPLSGLATSAPVSRAAAVEAQISRGAIRTSESNDGTGNGLLGASKHSVRDRYLGLYFCDHADLTVSCNSLPTTSDRMEWKAIEGKEHYRIIFESGPQRIGISTQNESGKIR